jgi:hypothetical protein
MNMHDEDGDNHIHGNAERGDARQKSKDKSQTAEELRSDGEKSERSGDVQLCGEESHCS